MLPPFLLRVPPLLATGLAGLFLILTACCPSVHPFYTDKDLVFDAKLIGIWSPKDDEEGVEQWRFEKKDETTYELTVREKDNKEGRFIARLFRLKDDRFLDLTPEECKFAAQQSELVAAAVFPGHLLLRVQQNETELKLAFLDADWLEKFLEANPGALAHTKSRNRLLLTASTEALQRFVMQHVDKGSLFSEPGILTRHPANVASR